MDEKNNVTKSHKVLLANRKNGAFSGVVDVLSFDVAEILLETELGMLLIKGHDLHVNSNNSSTSMKSSACSKLKILGGTKVNASSAEESNTMLTI